MNVSFCNSSAEMARFCAADPRWADVVRRVEDDLRDLRDHFSDETDLLCGWGHNFVCPRCAARLTFDFLEPLRPGRTYRCPHCGTEAAGPLLDQAWLYHYRQHYAAHLLSAALADRFGNKDAAPLIARVLDHYADRYAGYPLHGQYAGKGRVMGQSLDEAVFALHLLRAVAVCWDRFSPAQTERWYRKLFAPLADTIFPQANAIHNIPLWLQVAVGAIGLIFDKPEQLRRAMAAPYGIPNQAAEGYTADGFWNEYSTHYHYYATEALTFFAAFAVGTPEGDVTGVLAKAYRVPSLLSPDGYALPSLNDGWYPLNAGLYAPQLFLAARVLQDRPEAALLTAQLDAVRRRQPDAFYTPVGLLFGTEALLGGHPVPAASRTPVCFPATGLAVLPGPVFCILKSGVVRESHMHQDALSVLLPPFSDDLGTPGYSHPLTPGYYRQSLSHNTVLCDGQGQQGGVKAHRLTAVPGGFRAEVPELYPGVHAIRTVTVQGGQVCDEIELTADAPHAFTLLFKADGCCKEVAAPAADAVPASVHDPLLKNASAYPGARALTLTCRRGGAVLTATVTADGEADFRTADFPGNPADRPLRGILCTETGTHVRFRSHYSMKGSYDDLP